MLLLIILTIIIARILLHIIFLLVGMKNRLRNLSKKWLNHNLIILFLILSFRIKIRDWSIVLSVKFKKIRNKILGLMHKHVSKIGIKLKD